MIGRCCGCGRIRWRDTADSCRTCRTRLGAADDPLWSDETACAACHEVTPLLVATDGPPRTTCPRCGHVEPSV